MISSVKKPHQKASDLEIVNLYSEIGNIWLVAEKLGMCGQSVWERLKKLNLINDKNLFSKEEDDEIIRVYSEGFVRGEGALDRLVSKLSRTKQSVCRRARFLGLKTSYKRKFSDSLVEKFKEDRVDWWSKHTHPKGMLGKNHSISTRLAMKKTRKEIWDSYSEEEKYSRNNARACAPRKPRTNSARGNWKAGWREIGDGKFYFRSRWESNYARVLDLLKRSKEILDWEHEPKRFVFSKFNEKNKRSISYLPDFRVTRLDGSFYWVEVKGYVCARSKLNFALFADEYPDEELIVIGLTWFKENSIHLSEYIDGWETSRF